MCFVEKRKTLHLKLQFQIVKNNENKKKCSPHFWCTMLQAHVKLNFKLEHIRHWQRQWRRRRRRQQKIREKKNKIVCLWKVFEGMCAHFVRKINNQQTNKRIDHFYKHESGENSMFIGRLALVVDIIIIPYNSMAIRLT